MLGMHKSRIRLVHQCIIFRNIETQILCFFLFLVHLVLLSKYQYTNDELNAYQNTEMTVMTKTMDLGMEKWDTLV